MILNLALVIYLAVAAFLYDDGIRLLDALLWPVWLALLVALVAFIAAATTLERLADGALKLNAWLRGERA